MKLPIKFVHEISQFETIYCLFSGGYHSTTSALLLKDYGFDNVCLLHNKTYLEMKHVKDLIQDIIYRTDYSYIEIEPNLKGMTINEIMKQSLKGIPAIVEAFINKEKNYRDHILCCKLLKKTSARKFYTREIDKKTSVVISSLCPFESSNRSWHLRELRNRGTYIRLHKKMGNVFYAYPFRDIFKDKPFHDYLISKEIVPEHSGCVICPIVIAYKKYKS